MTEVHVSSPCRLHFGLLRLHESGGLAFGGLGMMVDRPRVQLRARSAQQWQTTGPEQNRAEEFARRALAWRPSAARPVAIAMQVEAVVPPHRGLGSGTQLGLAVAAAVRAVAGLAPGTPAELAHESGRGARSGIGSHGFVHGGLLWERGRRPGAGLAELTDRVHVCPGWRIVLVAPPEMQGRFGDDEKCAFAAAPPVPDSLTQRLIALAERHILPAARTHRLEEFGEAVYEYGRISGECFAAVQGGPYASAAIADLVSAIRAWGPRAVGQSSWGPTVFAIVECEAAADDLVLRLRRDPRWAGHHIQTAGADNRGALIGVLEDERAAPPAP
ncbi:MAG TPA: hypothetical protein VEQ85_12680 [Lacipirellulaceae bacterium]|nr:hypothetical protein [Lacipirellulaceae bacterium]